MRVCGYGNASIYDSRLIEMLIEINVLQFSHDMGEANESKGKYMR